MLGVKQSSFTPSDVSQIETPMNHIRGILFPFHTFRVVLLFVMRRNECHEGSVKVLQAKKSAFDKLYLVAFQGFLWLFPLSVLLCVYRMVQPVFRERAVLVSLSGILTFIFWRAHSAVRKINRDLDNSPDAALNIFPRNFLLWKEYTFLLIIP